MKIAICDDDRNMILRIDSLLTSELGKRGIAVSIDHFADGNGLIERGAAAREYDIIYLDYYMETVNGIDIAIKLRQFGVLGIIIYVSAVVEAAAQGYEVNAYRYIIKDEYFERTFTRCLDKLLKERFLIGELFKFSYKAVEYSIGVLKIAYCESQLRKLKIFVSNGLASENSERQSPYDTYTLYYKINDAEKRFKCVDFIRIHKGYLVNPLHIKMFTKTAAIMTNGVELLISPLRYPKVEQKYLQWKACL